MDGSGNTVKQGLSAGDILHCQWGYSMILNTYYRVLKGAEVGKMATVQEIPARTVASDQYGQAGRQMADLVSAPIGQPSKHRVKLGYRGAVAIKTQHGHAEVWNGQANTWDTYD